MWTLLMMLSAPAPACEPPGEELLRTLPGNGVEDVPVDARPVFVFDAAFQSDGDGLMPFLAPIDADGFVQVTRYAWTARDDTHQERRFIELVPSEPLAPSTRYGLYVASWADVDAWPDPVATFTTGEASAALEPDAPVVELVDVLPRAGDPCEAEHVKEYTLRIDPLFDDPGGLGLLHVAAVGASGWGGLIPPDYTLEVDWEDRPHEVVVTIPVPEDERRCLVVVREDGAGAWSAESLPACEPRPVEPEDTGDTGEAPVGTAKGGAGCSAAGGGLPAWLGLLPLLAIRRNR